MSLTFRPFALGEPAYSRRINKDEWQKHEGLIRDLHKSKQPTNVILSRLSDIGFMPTMGQLRRQMIKWGLSHFDVVDAVRTASKATSVQSEDGQLQIAHKHTRHTFEKHLGPLMSPKCCAIICFELQYILESANKRKGYKPSLSYDGLPPVVQDAITFTGELGCNYLWIDRFCISDDLEERTADISDMAQIYRDAVVTTYIHYLHSLVKEYLCSTNFAKDNETRGQLKQEDAEHLTELISRAEGQISRLEIVNRIYGLMGLSSPVSLVLSPRSVPLEQSRSLSTRSSSPCPSLLSDDTSMSSPSPRPSTPGLTSPLGALEELIDCFADDDHLDHLISSALIGGQMPAKQFEGKLLQELKQLARNLQWAASTKLETEIARFVGQSSRHIAEQLVSRQDPERAQMTTELLSRWARESRQLAIGRSIQEFQSPKDLTAAEEMPKDNEVENMASFPEFRASWEKTKAFVLGGEPYRKLIEDIEAYVHYKRLQSPQTAAENLTIARSVGEGVPNTDDRDWQFQDGQVEASKYSKVIGVLKGLPDIRIIHSGDLAPPSVVDNMKGGFENMLGEAISWWPLSPRGTRCSKGYSRVSWTCVCGSQLHFDLLDSRAEALQELLRCRDHAHRPAGPILPLYNSPGSGTGGRILMTALTPSTRTASNSSSNTTSSAQGSSSGNQSHVAVGCQWPSSSRHPTDEGYINVCVDQDRTMTRLVDLNTKTICEDTFIEKLLEAYSSIRGWRNFWTLSVCVDVAFIKFWCIDSNDSVACLGEALPPKSDVEYEYDSYEPLQDFEKYLRVVLRHGLVKGKICSSPGVPGFSLQQLPRKVPVRLNRKARAPGYGLYAVSERSFWKMVVVFVLSQFIAVIFAILWLLRHPDDLQNAAIIAAIVLAFLSYFRPSTRLDQNLKLKVD